MFVVKGVAENIPTRSLQFDCILPMSYAAGMDSALKTNSWISFTFYTYFELDNISSSSRTALVLRTIKDIYNQHNELMKADFTLQRHYLEVFASK